MFASMVGYILQLDEYTDLCIDYVLHDLFLTTVMMSLLAMPQWGGFWFLGLCLSKQWTQYMPWCSAGSGRVSRLLSGMIVACMVVTLCWKPHSGGYTLQRQHSWGSFNYTMEEQRCWPQIEGNHGPCACCWVIWCIVKSCEVICQHHQLVPRPNIQEVSTMMVVPETPCTKSRWLPMEVLAILGWVHLRLVMMNDHGWGW